MPKRSAWPVREDGWEERLVTRVRNMLNDVATRHSLTVAWTDTDLTSTDLACTFPRQFGLDFEIWFAFSHDEITFGGEDWYADMFPADGVEKWQDICRGIDGLITGDARIARFFVPGRSRPFWTCLQVRDEAKWRSISSGVGCAIPPLYRRVIMRNGRPLETSGVRPAWGSLTTLTGIVAGCLWFFS